MSLKDENGEYWSLRLKVSDDPRIKPLLDNPSINLSVGIVCALVDYVRDSNIDLKEMCDEDLIVLLSTMGNMYQPPEGIF